MLNRPICPTLSFIFPIYSSTSHWKYNPTPCDSIIITNNTGHPINTQGAPPCNGLAGILSYYSKHNLTLFKTTVYPSHYNKHMIRLYHNFYLVDWIYPSYPSFFSGIPSQHQEVGTTKPRMT